MAMNISQDYSKFYKGTSTSNTYGGGTVGEKQVVKYEFNTTDEHGNKIMDKMSREETLAAMKDISSRYGDDVIVEFSGDGMAALVESGKKANLDEIVKPNAQNQASFQSSVVQMENTHRIVIPNVQTNEKLYNSLEGADENTVKAANGIIGNYFLPHNVGDMSEEQRQDMIAFGMEEAKYLAANYLDKEKASDFLSAMETIAKYGVNGTKDKEGNMTYDIQKGYTVGSTVDTMDILKSKAPDLYDEVKNLNYNIINNPNGEKYGSKFLELVKRTQKVLDAPSGSGNKTNREEAEQKYKDWEKKTEETKLPEKFSGVSYDDLESFFTSLRKQSNLSDSWLQASSERFSKWLAG